MKVFLGAAAGVGKTYAMLSAAHELKQQGVDVVVGLAETHGQSETEALLQGLEVLPRRAQDQRDPLFHEFDLDAGLARRPQVLLLDDLAHANLAGSRHRYRWQDVQELLDAGIAVLTTVNIHHLESLQDLVRGISGILVRETVPDSLLDRAQDLVLVDLPPRELMQRQRQGKVVLPTYARESAESYFSATNLSALRELAMRVVAKRVGADLRAHMLDAGQAPPAVAQRILVAIDGSQTSEHLVRATRRMAERRHVHWTAVYVDSGRAAAATTEQANKALRLAQRLGGDAEVVRGTLVAEELLAFASRLGASTIVIGRTRGGSITRLLRRTVGQRVLRLAAHVELVIVSAPIDRPLARQSLPAAQRARTGLDPRAYMQALLMIGVAALVAGLIEDAAGVKNQALIFVVAVVASATRGGLGPALAAAVVGSLSYSFFFAAPRLSLHISREPDLITLALFVLVALICGPLAARLRAQVLLLRAAHSDAVALQRLSERLATAVDIQGAACAVAEQLASALDTRTCVLVADWETGVLETVAWHPVDGTPVVLTDADLAAARWAREHRDAAGRFTDTLASARWLFLPGATEDRCDALVGAGFGAEDTGIPPGRLRLAEAIAQQLALAIERIRLATDLERARVQSETERLRNALLSSVSHDLRSPLAAMIGAATSLRAYGEDLAAEKRTELAATMLEEGQRLDRYIQNLLDMAQLDRGTIRLERDWTAVGDVLGAALERLRRYYPKIVLDLRLEPELPLLYVHAALVEQALFNILENAARFSPEGAPIEIAARADQGELRLEISDRGPGIAQADRRRVFDMFCRAGSGDRNGHGTGLGLSICRGMIEAHGGNVEALDGPGGVGTTMLVRLPLVEPPTETEE